MPRVENPTPPSPAVDCTTCALLVDELGARVVEHLHAANCLQEPVQADTA